MKTAKFTLWIIPLFIVVFASTGRSAYTPGGGFKDSPHDFASTVNYEYASNTQAIGACTFCHTPHRAIQTKLLWNHTLSSVDFSWSDSTATVGGTLMPVISSATWKGPSKFCLSCHDGTVAIGDINWFNYAPHTTSQNGVLNTVKHTRNETITGRTTGLFNIANGADMMGNHPVAFPYPWYLGAVSTYNGVTTGGQLAADLAKEAGGAGPGAEFNTDPTTLGIRLFTDTGTDIVAGATQGKAGIECTSCHAVHNEPGYAQAAPLLRGTLTGNTSSATGYICMKCHTR